MASPEFVIAGAAMPPRAVALATGAIAVSAAETAETVLETVLETERSMDEEETMAVGASM